ncbi:DNA primase [Proteiniborus ethanoligenes]|uniref:DNA primase n=1 Tax=Proteiniborus ethanoligenes TaxID=415015 RepID=A0A1H3R340_9FIRM|nr:DNA primase [Proteiniborus ethanoligenes]SDZ20214.1 DNA primase [Proteiniborus ethanoligenes]
MPYIFNEDNIREIRESNDIVDIISQHIALKRTGSNFVGLCPFHNEKTPSFSVSPSKQMYHCFGCGAGGDVIAFIMEYSKLDFVEALKLLAERANIVLDEKGTNVNTKKEKEKNMLYSLNKEAARYYFNNLTKDKTALKYLYDRGIQDKTIRTYGLGYSNNSWDDIYTFLKSKGYSEIDIEKAGLIIKHRDGNRYYDRFRGRVMFPIIDVRGRIIGFGGRVVRDGQPKYLNSPDTTVFSKGYNLYGLNIAKKYSRDKILLVEGYMDVISLYQYGINYCVASLGTALTLNQSKLLKRYSNDIYICYDSDNAGLSAADRALDVLREENINAKVILLPTGKDPDDFIKENGRERFENLFKDSYNYLDFKINFYRKKYDLNTVEGKVSFTTDISSMLKNIKSPIELDAYVKKVSQETNISVDAIKEEINHNRDSYVNSVIKDKYINVNYRNNNKYNILPVKYNLESGHLMAEKKLLYFIINDKNIYNHIKDRFRPEDFLNHVYRRAADITYELYNSGEKINSEKIAIHFEGEELEKLKEVFNLKLDFDEEEKFKAVEDYIKKIYYYELKIKKNDIKEQIAEIQNNKARIKGDVEKLIKQLCMEIIEIDKELKLQQ